MHQNPTLENQVKKCIEHNRTIKFEFNFRVIYKWAKIMGQTIILELQYYSG